MKFVGNGWWPNVTCYVKLAILTYFVMNDPSVIQQLYAGNGTQVAQSLGESVKEQFDSTVAKTRAKSSGFNPLAMIPGGTPPGQAPAGPQYAAPAAANSSTVPPPGIAWPASSAAASYQAPAGQAYAPSPPFAATQPFATTAANSPSANPPPAANGLYAPAGNAAAPPSAAPAQAGTRGRFWQ
jgi:hypothetical protein